jgi:hypothetical protein
MPKNEHASLNDKDEESSRRRRARRTEVANTLRPSPMIVGWMHRALSRLAADRQQPQDAAAESARARSATPGISDKSSTAESTSIPDEVRARFVRVGRDFHFPSGARAFRDHGHKLVTQTENTAVIRALIDIAVQRGWNDITVTGTAGFRRDAWRLATVSGLVVRGYRPTEFEKQKLVRDLAAAREPSRRPEPLVDFPQQGFGKQPVTAEGRPATSARAARGPKNAKAEQSRSKARDSNERERAYAGRLLEHGPAPYGFDSQNEPSYFMRIQMQHGQKVLWGKDLERALHDAKISTGEEISVRQASRETVTVKRKERDQEGRVVREHDIKARRNQWEVSRAVRANEQETAPPRSRATSAHARQGRDTDSALRALKGAQLFANERISDPDQRSAFVNAVRDELAAALERGNGRSVAGAQRERSPTPARTLS